MNRTIATILIACAGAGCGPDKTVEERVFFCRDVWKDREKLKEPEALRAALDCYTPGSRKIVQAIREKGDAVYDLALDKVLDYAEALGPPEIEHNTAILSVKKGRTTHRVFLELDPVDNVWRIDLLELPRFWDPLDNNGVTQ